MNACCLMRFASDRRRWAADFRCRALSLVAGSRAACRMARALRHCRFVKITQQTKYAHGRHDGSSCFGVRATGRAGATIGRERRFSSAYGLTSMHCAPMRSPSSHEESSVLVRRMGRCALSRCKRADKRLGFGSAMSRMHADSYILGSRAPIPDRVSCGDGGLNWRIASRRPPDDFF